MFHLHRTAALAAVLLVALTLPAVSSRAARDVLPMFLTLYGDSIGGWGFTNATIRSPGPRFTLVAGTNVTFTFVSNDSNPAVNHDFFIDYDGSGTWNAGEPRSQDFNSTATLTWPVHLD